MSSEPATVTVSDEQAKRVLQAHRDEIWREEIVKRALVPAQDAGIYEVLKAMPGPPDYHSTDLDGKRLCRCPPLRFPHRFKRLPGDLVEINEGDNRPRPDSHRRLTAEEAAGAVTLQDGLRLQAARRPARAAAELVASVQNEIVRTEQELAAIQRRLVVDLGDSLKVAQNRQRSSEADFEKHLEGRSPEWRARAAELAGEIDARSAPPQ